MVRIYTRPPALDEGCMSRPLMPVMTRSARHRETTISMIDSDALLNDRLNSLTQREYATSRRVAVQQRREHKSNSGA